MISPPLIVIALRLIVKWSSLNSDFKNNLSCMIFVDLKNVLHIPCNRLAISWEFPNHWFVLTYYSLILQLTSISFRRCFCWYSSFFVLVFLGGVIWIFFVLSGSCDVNQSQPNISMSVQNSGITPAKMYLWRCENPLYI